MTGDGDLKSQRDLRIGLGVRSESDARLVIPDDVHIAASLARLTEPGSGIVSYKNHRVSPVKFYRVEPEDVTAIARQTGYWRPEPDPRLAEAFGEVYAERWTKRGTYLVPSSLPRRGPAFAPPGVGQDEFEAIVSGLSDLEQQAPSLPADDASSPARKRMREYIRKMGSAGVAPSAIVKLLEAENMKTARGTVQRWLKEDAAEGLVENTGSFGAWRWRGGR